MQFKNELRTRHHALFWPLTWNCIYLHFRQKNLGGTHRGFLGKWIEVFYNSIRKVRAGMKTKWSLGERIKGGEGPEQSAAARLISWGGWFTLEFGKHQTINARRIIWMIFFFRPLPPFKLVLETYSSRNCGKMTFVCRTTTHISYSHLIYSHLTTLWTVWHVAL